MTHFGGQSTSQVRETMLVALYRSKVRFFRQHRSPWSAACLTVVFMVASRVRRAVRAALSLQPPGVVMGRKALWSDPEKR